MMTFEEFLAEARNNNDYNLTGAESWDDTGSLPKCKKLGSYNKVVDRLKQYARNEIIDIDQWDNFEKFKNEGDVKKWCDGYSPDYGDGTWEDIPKDYYFAIGFTYHNADSVIKYINENRGNLYKSLIS